MHVPFLEIIFSKVNNFANFISISILLHDKFPLFCRYCIFLFLVHDLQNLDLMFYACPSVLLCVCVCVCVSHEISGTASWIILKFWVMLGAKYLRIATRLLFWKKSSFSRKPLICAKKSCFSGFLELYGKTPPTILLKSWQNVDGIIPYDLV
jgi:hypothetical protein